MKTIFIILCTIITLSGTSGLMNEKNNYPYWQNIKKSFNISK